MLKSARLLLVPLALMGAAAISPVTAHAQGMMADLHADVNDVQKKLVDLAKAIPESAYLWRPMTGTRSVGELFKHVISDNYLIPISMGLPAPAATGISATDMKSAEAYEARKMTKAEIVAALEASFTHLHTAMGLTTDANASQPMKFFGMDFTRRKAMIGTVTHLHEHLGQGIAYARSNSVVPPWSK